MLQIRWKWISFFLRKLFDSFIVPFTLFWANLHIWFSMGISTSSKILLAICSLLVFIMIAVLDFKRVTTPIAFTITFIVMLLNIDSNMVSIHVVIFLAIIISAFLPTVTFTLRGIEYEKGLRKWLQSLRNNELPLPRSDAQLEKNYQHAITFQYAKEFQTNFREQLQNLQTDKLYPFLISPSDTKGFFEEQNDALRREYISDHSGDGSTSSSSGSGGGGGAGAF